MKETIKYLKIYIRIRAELGVGEGEEREIIYQEGEIVVTEILVETKGEIVVIVETIVHK